MYSADLVIAASLHYYKFLISILSLNIELGLSFNKVSFYLKGTWLFVQALEEFGSVPVYSNSVCCFGAIHILFGGISVLFFKMLN